MNPFTAKKVSHSRIRASKPRVARLVSEPITLATTASSESNPRDISESENRSTKMDTHPLTLET